VKPKILHLSTARLISGGVERFLLGLCRGLQGEYQFSLLSGAQEVFTEQIQAAGCESFKWEVRHTFDLSSVRALAKAIDLIQPAIVHIHEARAGLLARPLLKWRGIKTVYTVHLPPYYFRWPRFTRLRQALYASIERVQNTFLTDAVVYPSQRGWADAIRKRYVPAQKGFCVQNGIDLTPFAADQSQRGAGTPTICTVARLSPEKNIGLLLEAASILKQRGLSFRLWIVGDGADKNILETKAGELGLAPQTQFWGEQKDIASILFQADIFALTSWYEGGRAQAVMEAQAAGLPCVLSNVGDNALMAADESGLLFNEGDVQGCAEQLQRLLLNQKERSKMGEKARQKAFAAYGLQDMASQYRKIYQSLL
jgi:glycosyltransferase involved in cell wall biosynthesis